MREKKKLERWIRETVRAGDMQAMRKQARDLSVSEETLMRYRAGLLSSDEESELERLGLVVTVRRVPVGPPEGPTRLLLLAEREISSLRNSDPG